MFGFVSKKEKEKLEKALYEIDNLFEENILFPSLLKKYQLLQQDVDSTLSVMSEYTDNEISYDWRTDLGSAVIIISFDNGNLNLIYSILTDNFSDHGTFNVTESSSEKIENVLEIIEAELYVKEYISMENEDSINLQEQIFLELLESDVSSKDITELRKLFNNKKNKDFLRNFFIFFQGTNLSGKNLLTALYNSRVVIDSSDTEDGDIALFNYLSIVEIPELLIFISKFNSLNVGENNEK